MRRLSGKGLLRSFQTSLEDEDIVQQGLRLCNASIEDPCLARRHLAPSEIQLQLGYADHHHSHHFGMEYFTSKNFYSQYYGSFHISTFIESLIIPFS